MLGQQRRRTAMLGASGLEGDKRCRWCGRIRCGGHVAIGLPLQIAAIIKHDIKCRLRVITNHAREDELLPPHHPLHTGQRDDMVGGQVEGLM